ncbi:MAG: hypothetical protein J6C93_01225 [Clostridia bacterium]|nr:hypothetical protein [Clostridia bacterium]
MLKLFTEKNVRNLISRLKEEYADVLHKQRERTEELKKENVALRARLSKLEGEREDVTDAVLKIQSAEKRVIKEGAAALENERRELQLLAEKCRALSGALIKKYPDEEDCRQFASFTDELNARLGLEEESGFHMEDVLAPTYPLDLEQLCKDLGVMEEQE